MHRAHAHTQVKSDKGRKKKTTSYKECRFVGMFHMYWENTAIIAIWNKLSGLTLIYAEHFTTCGFVDGTKCWTV